MTKNKIKVKIFNDFNLASQYAANLIITAIQNKPELVLGLATGSTPEKLYNLLINAYKNKIVDFSKIITCNLDEYYPIDRSHNQSYWNFMHEKLFNHINIHPDNKHILNGEVENINLECDQYEMKIKKAGGIDLQILGIGNNGHIAFNEPGSNFKSRTRLVQLEMDTIEANSRFFKSKEQVPKQALTMGLGTIMGAKKIILLASGENKASAIKQSFNGPVSESRPASILQKHSDCTFILEKEAASLLNN